MSDCRYALGKHQDVDCLHVLIDGNDGQTHIPIDDLLASAVKQGFVSNKEIEQQIEQLLLRLLAPRLPADPILRWATHRSILGEETWGATQTTVYLFSCRPQVARLADALNCLRGRYSFINGSIAVPSAQLTECPDWFVGGRTDLEPPLETLSEEHPCSMETL